MRFVPLGSRAPYARIAWKYKPREMPGLYAMYSSIHRFRLFLGYHTRLYWNRSDTWVQNSLTLKRFNFIKVGANVINSHKHGLQLMSRPYLRVLCNSRSFGQHWVSGIGFRGRDFRWGYLRLSIIFIIYGILFLTGGCCSKNIWQMLIPIFLLRGGGRVLQLPLIAPISYGVILVLPFNLLKRNSTIKDEFINI